MGNCDFHVIPCADALSRRYGLRSLELLSDLLRSGTEIHCRPAPAIGCTVGDDQTVLAGNDVALSDRLVVLDADGREPDGILAIAGAALDDLLAVLKRVRQRRVGLAVVAPRMVD